MKRNIANEESFVPNHLHKLVNFKCDLCIRQRNKLTVRESQIKKFRDQPSGNNLNLCDS